jgi:hypothetical protein
MAASGKVRGGGARRGPGRKRKIFPAATIESFTTSPHIRHYVGRLLLTGLYGRSATEVVERLVSRSIEQLIASGHLARLAEAEVAGMMEPGEEEESPGAGG